MVKKHLQKKTGIYHYVLFLMLTVAVGISAGWDFNFSRESDNITVDLKLMRAVFPKANHWVEISENVYLILSGNDTIGKGLLVTDNRGYGGKVPFLIGLKGDTIKKIQLLPNNETTEFMEYIKEDQLLAQWEGMEINQVLNTEVDAISGATESSNAIIRGMRQGAAQYLNEEQSHFKRDFLSISKDLLFLLVILLSLLMSHVGSIKKYRWIYLIIVILVIGIYTGKVLSVKQLYGWLSNGIAWRTNWQSTILLLMAVTMPLLKRPKFYCNYLCPMGAFQEIIHKISPAKKRNIKLKSSPLSLGEIYLALILISLVLGFKIELSYLEPFMVFMYKVAGIAMFVFAAVIAILSFFFNKPWCTFCPTGCLINKVHNK
ncbi:MAG: FMN-binding protein [Bacteroidetes bacterium]|nr:FMN-binding protein [Bacteroidota bacterium]